MSCQYLLALCLMVPLITANSVREKRAAVPPGGELREVPKVGKIPDINPPSQRNAGIDGDFVSEMAVRNPKDTAFKKTAGGIKSAGNPYGKLPSFDHKKAASVRIADSVECASDVKQFCSDAVESNNFMVLDCLQDSQRTDEKLSNECHHYLWNYKINMTLDIRFDKASQDACDQEYKKISECARLELGKGLVIPCLVEHYDEIVSKTCTNFINKMAGIIFSDYRFMDRFISDCQKDIASFRCGRMDSMDSEDSPHSQGKVVACLSEHKKELSKVCKKAILHVAELQADDYHLDRPLYYACREDRERFCAKVVAGKGAIFKCLYQHLGDNGMTDQCRERLEVRQQLIAEDVKINKVFYDACRQDIQSNKCAQGEEGEGEIEDDLSRTTILLCLEAAHNNGAKLQANCFQEMFELRSELMQDYKISPELVSACQIEIQSKCNGLELGGETIECLMQQSMKKKKNNKRGDGFSDECRAQLENLLHVADPGEDIRLDKPLQRACGDVVTAACSKLAEGTGDIITCLLENLDHEDMTDECEEHLLVIQYFAIRDFKLDHHLYKECRKDAKKLCHTDEMDNPKSMEPQRGPLVFSCLYSHLKSEVDVKPSRGCIHEIRRVMKERSTRIELHPEVEDACIKDLSEHCSDDDEHYEKGAEMECLQMNLEDLLPECRDKVSAFTEEQSENIDMDRILMKACTPMIEQFCSSYLDNGAMPEEVLECLIKHKTDENMHHKCAAGIEHHQLISLKDFKFNKKFRESCQASVDMFCKKKKTKFEVVACLSEHVRNDTLTDVDQRIEKKCQKQLRFEILQRGESFKLDKEMEKACRTDREKFCAHKNAGEAEVIECLKSHKKRLSEACHKIVFKREQEEAVFGDWGLMKTCKTMLLKFDCSTDMGDTEALECLKQHKEDEEFTDNKCRTLVQRRILEQTRDYRLDVHLQKACRLDIPKFCAHVFEGVSTAMEMDGLVINCLKRTYATRPKILSKDCEREIKSKIKEAAQDINQNPVMMKICKEDIKTFCMDKLIDLKDDDLEPYRSAEGAVMECLKNHFAKLRKMECKKEVAYVIQESRIDINIDPLLHSKCQQDLLSLCKDVNQGSGRLMSCLLSQLEINPGGMTADCRRMMQGRKDLWELSAQVMPFETFGEVAEQVMLSPSRNYFMAVLFSVVGVIFIVGLTCGRVTKRVRAEVKNK